MEIEIVRGLVIIGAIVTGTTGLLALSIGWRALLVLPVFGLAFALPDGTVVLLAKAFIAATGTLLLYLLLSAHLRQRLTVPEFGRPSRRSRATSAAILALGAGTVMASATAIWAI